MTFYLCMTGIHIRLTSGRGKEAALRQCILKAVFEGWQTGMGSKREGSLQWSLLKEGFISNVHITKFILVWIGLCPFFSDMVLYRL